MKLDTQIKKKKKDTQLMIKPQLETNLNNILSTNIYITFIDKIYWKKKIIEKKKGN